MSHQAQLICQSHSKNQFPKSYLTLKRLAFFEKYILEREGAKKKKKKKKKKPKKKKKKKKKNESKEKRNEETVKLFLFQIISEV